MLLGCNFQDSSGLRTDMDFTPNLFSYVALLCWPIVALLLYKFCPVTQATVWTILGGFLLLPVGLQIKFEMIPQFDKNTIPNVCALIGCIAVSPRLLRIERRTGLIEILIAIYISSPIVTSYLNSEPIVVGPLVLPGVGWYDGISAAIGQLMFFLAFIIGRRFLQSAADSEEILRALVVAGLIYSLPMLFEIRFSPQLHNWIYGFHPSEFLQQMRDEGFRPMVFTGHGLIASFFTMTTAVAAAAFWRVKVRAVNLPPPAITAYLLAMLVLCKSAGSLIYGLVAMPLVKFASGKLQLRIAVILVTVALAFPVLRTADLFPIDAIVKIASEFSQDRADSLAFRFRNERALLERANEKFWFGWGRYGRSRVYDQYGGDTSVTDGFWIITLGQFGFVGFVATFLLLTLPVFSAASAFRFVGSFREGILLSALALIVAMGVINQLVNASVNAWTLLLMGALQGRAEFLLTSSRRLGSKFRSRKLASGRIGQNR
jgi:hypothetical protein